MQITLAKPDIKKMKDILNGVAVGGMSVGSLFRRRGLIYAWPKVLLTYVERSGLMTVNSSKVAEDAYSSVAYPRESREQS